MDLRIVIDELDPLHGRASLDGRHTWTFAGWMELIEQVERLKEERRDAPPEPPSRVPA